MLSSSQLTNGEKLFTLRRREGNTQAQEAAQRGCPLSAYKDLEGDEESDYVLSSGAVGSLETYEACVLLRRREGMTLDQLAYDTGLTKWYLCQIERGKAPVDTLQQYWDTASV